MSRADEIYWETAFDAIYLPLFPGRPEAGTARAAKKEDFRMSTLSDEEKKVAAAAGMSADEFATKKARLSQSKNTHGLTRDQLAVAAAAGMSSRAFARELSVRTRSKTAIAAGDQDRQDKPGLVRAHQEVDRAHKAAYDAVGYHSSAENTSDRELLDAALAALEAYDPTKDDDEAYDLLLNGSVYVMRLLNRVAPAYADIKK